MNLKITLQQMRVFRAVARVENLKVAAEQLNLTKGAVSQSLQQLESRLGTMLFDRVHPRLKLNQEGRTLLPMADELINRAQKIELQFQPNATTYGRLHIGASQTIGNYLLPKLLSTNIDQSKQDTQVTIENTSTLCRMLLSFELDIALIEGQNTFPELHTENWFHDEMLLVASPDHYLAQRQQINFRMLGSQNWVLREKESGSRAQFEHYIHPHITELSSVLELSTLEAVMLAVESGIGITFISQLAAQTRLDSGQLVQLKMKQSFKRQLSLAWHKQKYLSGHLLTFNQFLHDEAKNNLVKG